MLNLNDFKNVFILRSMNYFQKVNYKKPGSLDLVSLNRGIKCLVYNDNITYKFFLQIFNTNFVYFLSKTNFFEHPAISEHFGCDAHMFG